MEVIINQAEEARDAALNNVEMLSREYFPMRQEINKMRESDLLLYYSTFAIIDGRIVNHEIKLVIGVKE